MSIFEIHLENISNILANKYNKLACNLKEIISTQAKKLTHNILSEFLEIHIAIHKQPENIEELNDIQTFINHTPSLITSFIILKQQSFLNHKHLKVKWPKKKWKSTEY